MIKRDNSFSPFQLVLLKESWHELFILGAAQYLPPLELNPLIMASIEQNGDTKELMEEATKFQEVVMKFKQLHVDLHEYACMRATILFKTGEYQFWRRFRPFRYSVKLTSPVYFSIRRRRRKRRREEGQLEGNYHGEKSARGQSTDAEQICQLCVPVTAVQTG